jgi:hypothetical protein
MSHFKLFVVGENIEDLLDPFDENDQVEFYDCSEEIAEKWATYQTEKPDEYKDIDDFAENYYGYRKEDGVYGYWRNPQAKWDWWVVGGRYDNYLINKHGASGDSFQVKDIDWEAMERRNAENAAQWWEEAHQEKNAAMKGFLYGITEGMTKEQYIAQRTGVSAYAFLVGDQWVERGEMGWFGMASNEKDAEQWETEMTKFLKGLEPEQYLTVVDCHI